MERQKKRTWAEISLGNLEHNVRNMQKQLPEGCKYLGVVKANAYGHGVIPVAKRLEEMGVKHLAVACYDEAAELRDAGITAQILILGPSPAYLAKEIVELGNVVQAVGSLQAARNLSAELKDTQLSLPVHMKLYTGMCRTGFSVQQSAAMEEAKAALELRNLDFQGVFTHFAVSDEHDDEFTAYQYHAFLRAVGMLEDHQKHTFSVRHCTNSGAMVNYPGTYMDLVRPGIAQYGLYPGADRGDLDLKPVMQLKTRVVEITDHMDGDTISYGRTYTCEGQQRFAVLSIGYADGLHRALSGKMDVYINGHKAKQCGRICMDMCMADITELPNVQVGDEVEIFGEHQSVDLLAQLAD
ncbi:MAG: alanine racemase, partial [Oscillospiraceae bacterium]|nr:alanine racemase [Oscillospiraceae bacterium]